jgi:hypothetical protein
MIPATLLYIIFFIILSIDWVYY